MHTNIHTHTHTYIYVPGFSGPPPKGILPLPPPVAWWGRTCEHTWLRKQMVGEVHKAYGVYDVTLPLPPPCGLWWGRTCVRSHTYMHPCKHAYMHTCIHAYRHARVRANIHMWSYMYLLYLHSCVQAWHIDTYIQGWAHRCKHWNSFCWSWNQQRTWHERWRNSYAYCRWVWFSQLGLIWRHDVGCRVWGAVIKLLHFTIESHGPMGSSWALGTHKSQQTQLHQSTIV